jgi:hypothetical protein
MEGKREEQPLESEQREDDRNTLEDGSPVPDPEQDDDRNARDVPTAD